MTRRERLERKLEKREEWASSAKDRSAQRFAAADKICEHIPFGQPILVGHHSEKHARADQKRIHNHMDKGCEELNKAKYHEQKAAGLEMQLKNTIFSDDENAIEAIKAKIAKLEHDQAVMKECNAIVRKYKKDPDSGIQRLLEVVKSPSIAAELFKPDFAGRIGFPSYALTNNNANIRRLKERIVDIERRQARTEKAEAAGGVLIEGSDYVRVTFPEKPDYSIIRALKDNGFRWSGGSWHGLREDIPEEVKELVNA